MAPKYAGIDVSAHQKDIDFNAVKVGKIKDLPISFAMIRLSIDKKVDEYAVKNIKAALSAGLDVGVYHYSYAMNADEAIAEANLVLKTIKDNGLDGKITLPIAFDIEKNAVFKLDKAVCTDIAMSFMNRIAEANYQPILYTYAAAYNSYFNKEIVSKYPLWISAFIGESKLNNTFGIKDYAMWQAGVAGHSDYDIDVIGSISGVKGRCDYDYMYEDLSAKIKAEGKNKFLGTGGDYTVTISGISSKAIAEDISAYAETKGGKAEITEKTAPEPEKTDDIKVGDKVKMQSGAPIYGTADKWASWVYQVIFYAREINGSRVVIAPKMTGDITGAVDKKYLIKA